MSAIEYTRPLPPMQKFKRDMQAFGRLVRDTLKGEALLWYLFALVVIALWATSAILFGLPGLYMPAVGLVPVVYLLLIIISRG